MMQLLYNIVIVGNYICHSLFCFQTTFLQHIVGKDYPGIRIGPEPTTDKFIVIMNGEKDSVIPGTLLIECY